MGDLFKTLTAGFSRFALAWLVPSVATLMVFSVYVYPAIENEAVVRPIFELTAKGRIETIAVFSFAAVLLSLLFALTALPTTRLLEGYLLPDSISNGLRKRQIRRRRKLQISYQRTPTTLIHKRGLTKEKLDLYPEDEREILPTRLGNAYKAIETYGIRQFNLDIQTFNYELFSVASPRLLQDADDARASVDFFTGFTAQLSVLSLISGTIGISQSEQAPLITALVAAILARLAYLTAIRNMTDLMYVHSALINTGRTKLAAALGYSLPGKIGQERRLWHTWTTAVQLRSAGRLARLDDLRLRDPGSIPNTAASAAED